MNECMNVVVYVCLLCSALVCTHVLLCVSFALQRQFPRASGYPEDPATGVAAAALALAFHTLTGQSSAKFYQGTAMGRPSVLLVDHMEMKLMEEEEEEEETRENDNSPSAQNQRGAEEESDDDDETAPSSSTPNDYYRRKTATASFELLGRVEIDDRAEICLDGV